MRLSIIVPVYNVEQWLSRCLNSLFKQGLDESDFEVVVINDGSKDGSLVMAQEFAAIHSNVKVITRENGGLSAARNTGIIVAQGKYVWFVDSDDFIEPNSIKHLLEYAVENKLDVMCFNLQLYFEDGGTKPYLNQSVCNGTVVTGDEFLVAQCMPPAAWAALYRREFLLKNELTFKEGILHEDLEFTPRAYFLAKKISYIDKVVYNYFQREGSIMRSNQNAKRANSLLSVCDSLYEFKKVHVGSGTKAWYVFDKEIAFVFSQSLAFVDVCGKGLLATYKNKPYYPLTVNSLMNKKEVLKIMLMNFSLKLYICVSKFLR